MRKQNEKITFTGKEMVDVLNNINIILLSLHKIGSYYMDKDKQAYEKETNRFIDDWKVTHRLARIRTILSEKFDSTLGDDDMDDLERAFEGVKYWRKPGDKPPEA